MILPLEIDTHWKGISWMDYSRIWMALRALFAWNANNLLLHAQVHLLEPFASIDDGAAEVFLIRLSVTNVFIHFSPSSLILLALHANAMLYAQPCLIQLPSGVPSFKTAHFAPSRLINPCCSQQKVRILHFSERVINPLVQLHHSRFNFKQSVHTLINMCREDQQIYFSTEYCCNPRITLLTKFWRQKRGLKVVLFAGNSFHFFPNIWWQIYSWQIMLRTLHYQLGFILTSS